MDLSHDITSLLEAHLERCQKKGLDLSVRAVADNDDQMWACHSEMAYSWFLNRLPRLQRCKFVGFRRDIPPDAPPNASFPLLESLSLDVSWRSGPPNWFLDAVHAAPNLRQVSLEIGLGLRLPSSQASQMLAHNPTDLEGGRLGGVR
ncbi:hypothetical protein V5O48_018015, partial [Marasmius crinis-equi]